MNMSYEFAYKRKKVFANSLDRGYIDSNASIIIEVIASILLSLINTAFVVTITWLLKVIYYCQKCVIHTLNYNNNTNQEEDVIVVTICNRTML